MAIFYPRKQTVIIFILCLAFVLSAVFIYGRPSFAKKYNYNQAATGLAAPKIYSPSDAIPTNSDWEKEFFEASASPAASKTAPTPAKSVADEPLTLTDRFGRDFFTRFTLLKQNDLMNDKESVQTVIDQSMNDLVAASPLPKMYFKKDILISTGSGPEAEKAYANAVGLIFNTKAPREDAALVATQALEENDPEELAGIENIVDGYATLLTEMKKLPAPADIADLHIGLLNGISSMHFVAVGMSKSFSDPIQALIALKMYSSAQDSLRSSILKLKNRFASQEITFAASESWNFFSTVK